MNTICKVAPIRTRQQFLKKTQILLVCVLCNTRRFAWLQAAVYLRVSSTRNKIR